MKQKSVRGRFSCTMYQSIMFFNNNEERLFGFLFCIFSNIVRFDHYSELKITSHM